MRANKILELNPVFLGVNPVITKLYHDYEDCMYAITTAVILISSSPEKKYLTAIYPPRTMYRLQKQVFNNVLGRS